MLNIKQALEDNKKVLPQAPIPIGNYQATVGTGKLIFISGQLPLRNGKLIYKGKLGKELTTEEGRTAAELCALNLLSHMKTTLKNHNLKQVVKIESFINASESFIEHAQVLDGASDLLFNILSDKAGHTRTVMGCTSLPLDAAIEIAAIIELE